MRGPKPPYLPLLAFLTALAGLGALTGCANGLSTEDPFAEAQTNLPEGLNAQYQGLKTFGEILLSASLTVDAAAKTATFMFTELNLDSLDADGNPGTLAVAGFSGAYAAGVEASLPNAGEPGYGVKLACLDDACTSATITITKHKGYLSGTAPLTYAKVSSAKLVLGVGTQPAAQAAAWEIYAAAVKYPTTTTFEAYRRADGKGSYAITIEYSNAGLDPASADYFVKKTATLAGAIGVPSSPVSLTLETTNSAALTTSLTGSPKGVGIWAPSTSLLQIVFSDDQGLKSLSAQKP